MNKLLPFCFLLLSSCDLLDTLNIKDIDEEKGPCTILLADGSSIETTYPIKISERTNAITYRDENGKLWSLFNEDYESYSCGN